jgi:hypothetical protein
MYEKTNVHFSTQLIDVLRRNDILNSFAVSHY